VIELAEPHDGPQIVSLTVNAGVFTPEEVAVVAELWDAYIRQGEASGYVFLVYRQSERVLGYACFGPHSLTEGTFDLYWIAVDMAVRRQGIGRALIQQVEQEVDQRGGRLVVVETSSTAAYAPTRRFYESCGYEAEAVIRDFYTLGDDLVIFTKRLR